MILLELSNAATAREQWSIANNLGNHDQPYLRVEPERLRRRPIQTPVLDRLRNVCGTDAFACAQIGDRPGDFNDPHVRSRREA